MSKPQIYPFLCSVELLAFYSPDRFLYREAKNSTLDCTETDYVIKSRKRKLHNPNAKGIQYGTLTCRLPNSR